MNLNFEIRFDFVMLSKYDSYITPNSNEEHLNISIRLPSKHVVTISIKYFAKMVGFKESELILWHKIIIIIYHLLSYQKVLEKNKGVTKYKVRKKFRAVRFSS